MMVAIRSASAIPEVRMTVDEYLTADLPEGYRYELVDGVVRMSPTPSPGHDSILFVLQSALFEHHKRHPGEIAHVSPRASIVIPGRARVREPDLAVYRIWEGAGRGYGAWKKLTPLIAVEIVSPGQETRDFSAKRDDYWIAGIEEYWIVDGMMRTLTVLNREATGWVEAVFDKAGDVYTTPRLTGFEMRVGALFGE